MNYLRTCSLCHAVALLADALVPFQHIALLATWMVLTASNSSFVSTCHLFQPPHDVQATLHFFFELWPSLVLIQRLPNRTRHLARDGSSCHVLDPESSTAPSVSMLQASIRSRWSGVAVDRVSFSPGVLGRSSSFLVQQHLSTPFAHLPSLTGDQGTGLPP